MHFEPQAVPAELPGLVRRFISITGWRPWAKRLHAFDDQIAANSLLGRYFQERYPIELAMARLHSRMQFGQRIKLPSSDSETALFSFIAMVARVHQRMTPVGQNRLAGMLRSGLDDDAGLAPLEHEMAVASHMMDRGFDVTFADIETGGGFDFLIEKNGAVMEVECKVVSGDLGRKIHLRRVYQFGGKALPIMEKALRLRAGGQLARVKIPGRLFGADAQIAAICGCLSQALEAGESITGAESCTVEYRAFSLAETPFETMHPDQIGVEDARRCVEKLLGSPLVNTVMVMRPYTGVVMVAVESVQRDALIDGLVRQLKDSVKRQLSGKHPAAVCVKFVDITKQGLREIVAHDNAGKPSALKVATSYLLNRADWKCVHTLAYLTTGQAISSRSVVGESATSSIRTRGDTYCFTNPNNEMAGDRRFTIF